MVYFRTILVFLALLIVGASLIFTDSLVKSLAEQEREKIQLWADATRLLVEQEDIGDNFDFIWGIIESNKDIPVLIVDQEDNVVSARNFKEELNLDALNGNKEYFNSELSRLRDKNEVIIIDMGDGAKQFIYYDESNSLKQLAYFPYVQLSVISVFLVIVIVGFSNLKNAEQNKVWVGLSKETAHQLGTPITSLIAWVDILKMKYAEDATIAEMGKDVKRLRIIAERFSKIGSKPEFVNADIITIVNDSIDYMRKRSSKKIVFDVQVDGELPLVRLNTPLFQWVVENLSKNAIDAMNGSGSIDVDIVQKGKYVQIDVSDTGKGIEKNKFRTIFQPGYTTKTRGWGLGLSLAKRIIHEYHGGKIFVESSEIGLGTTFRILLPIASV